MKNIYIHSPSHSSAMTLHLPTIYFLLKSDYIRNGGQKLNWIDPILEELSPESCLIYLKSYIKIDYFVMSVYNWNEDHMINLAKLVKKEWPDCIIIAGGYQVTSKWIEYEFIDRVVLGDPEGTFYKAIDESSEKCVIEGYIKNFEYSAIVDNEHELKKLIKKAKNQYKNLDIVYVWETNRGCPYSCVFCNWGNTNRTKLKIKSLEMIKKELNILLDSPIDILRIADANFGILSQDEIIADYIISHNQYLKDLDISWAKNNKTVAFRVAKKLQDAKLISRFKYGLQDIHEDVGIAIKRPEKTHWIENFIKFKQNNIQVPLRIDLIIGLPNQTKNGFFEQLQKFVDSELDIPVIPLLQILPNTPLHDKNYIDEYQIRHRKIKEISVPGYINPSHRKKYGNYGLDYSVDTVISNSTLSEKDIHEMISFSGIVQALYQGEIINKKINYIDLYENFFKNSKYPFVNNLYNNLQDYLTDNPYESFVNIPLFDLEENIKPHIGSYFYTNILYRSHLFSKEFEEFSGIHINKNVITYQNSNFKTPIDFIFKIGWQGQIKAKLV